MLVGSTLSWIGSDLAGLSSVGTLQYRIPQTLSIMKLVTSQLQQLQVVNPPSHRQRLMPVKIRRHTPGETQLILANLMSTVLAVDLIASMLV